MDLKLPEIDGFTATKVIRSIKKDIPIIAQSAFTASSDKEEALKVGCNDYITKPIDKNLLFSKIEKCLNQH